MLTLEDGPCKGSLLAKRAPLYLRAVIDPKTGIDVLDQVEDTPKESEKVHVYKLAGEAGTVHLNFGGGKGGWYVWASYRHVPDVDGEEVRDNEKWQAWAKDQVKKEV